MNYTPKSLLIVLLLILSISIYSQETVEMRKKHFNHNDGLAIQGYDPVAYFTERKAKEGKDNITFEYKGITYKFSSKKNRDIFKANPEKYEPTYGGWCAYAMGVDGSKVKIDPETFKIKDGKLYLFYNWFFINTLPKWNEDEKNLESKANQYWKKIIKK